MSTAYNLIEALSTCPLPSLQQLTSLLQQGVPAEAIEADEGIGMATVENPGGNFDFAADGVRVYDPR